MGEKKKDLISNLCPQGVSGQGSLLYPRWFCFRNHLGEVAPLFYIKSHLKIEDNNAKFQINGKRIFS